MVKNHIFIILHQTFTTSSPNLHHIITKPSLHHHQTFTTSSSRSITKICHNSFTTSSSNLHRIFQKSINKLWITYLSQFFHNIFIKVLHHNSSPHHHNSFTNLHQTFNKPSSHLYQGLSQHLSTILHHNSSPHLR